MALFKDIVKAVKRFFQISSKSKPSRPKVRQARKISLQISHKRTTVARRKIQKKSELMEDRKFSPRTKKLQESLNPCQRLRSESKVQDVSQTQKKRSSTVSRKSTLKSKMGKEDLKKSTMKSKKILGHPLVSRIPVKSAKNTHSKKVLSLGSPEKAKTVRKKPGILIGEVTHYFAKIQVCVVKVLQHNISLEDKVRILGKGTDFVQVVKSLQIESEDVRSAKKGQLVGLKVTKEVKVGNKVYKAT